LLLYGLSAYVLSIIPVNNNMSEHKKEYTIYIKSNGVHTDLVLPIKTDVKDWSEQIKYEHIQSKDSTHQYLAFGWGDKGFYLDTPEWSDLKFSTAFKAAFNLGTSAMHTTFYKKIQENENCVKIEISKEQYLKLITFIEASFQYDTNGNPIFIQAITYGKNDSFYEAHRTYNLFYTCNTWANQALKKAHMKAAFWTPADKGIFYHYQ
jgi:uncharacterized protein (TIGR02117 family)